MKKVVFILFIVCLITIGVYAQSPEYSSNIHNNWIKIGNEYLLSDFKFKVIKTESNEWYISSDESTSTNYYFQSNEYINGIFSGISVVYGVNKGTGTIEWLRDNITASNYDIYNPDGTVFFSPPIPPLAQCAENIPAFVMKNLIPVVGVGILTISLMLLPGLLGRLYNYL